MPIDQVATVVDLVTDLLGGAVLGAYLHGSSTIGGLRPTSDLDLLVVTSRRTTAAEQRELIERLLPISGPGDPTGRARSIDLEIVAQRDVRPWRYPGRLDLQFGDWYRPEFASGNLAPWNPANPDLTILLAMALQADHPLVGPRPAELFGPVPWADVCRAMLEGIPDLRSYLAGDERNVVLTFARIWAALATGEFNSKDGAADWAVPRLPARHRAVLAQARSLYVRGVPTEDWGDLLPLVRPCVDHMVGEIERVATDAATPS